MADRFESYNGRIFGGASSSSPLRSLLVPSYDSPQSPTEELTRSFDASSFLSSPRQSSSSSASEEWATSRHAVPTSSNAFQFPLSMRAGVSKFGSPPGFGRGHSDSPPSVTAPQKKFEYECVFCKGNKEPEYVYKNHPIRLNETVVCPSLRSHVCSICGATGDNAHTIKYCPYNHRGFYASMRQMQVTQGPGGNRTNYSSLSSGSSDTSDEFEQKLRSGQAGIASASGCGYGSSRPRGLNDGAVVNKKLCNKSTAPFLKNLQQFYLYRISEIMRQEEKDGGSGPRASTLSDSSSQ